LPQKGTTSNVPSTSKQIKNKNDDTSPSPNHQNQKNGLGKRILTELGIGLAIKAGVIAIGLVAGEAVGDFVSDSGGGDGSIEESNTENTLNNSAEGGHPASGNDLSHIDTKDGYPYGGDPVGCDLFYQDPQVGYPYGGDPTGRDLFYQDPQVGYPEGGYPYGGNPYGDVLSRSTSWIPYPNLQVGYPEGYDLKFYFLGQH
jgi:hypothetical protein